MSLFPKRNSNFPSTFIEEIHVSLDDPDHEVTLTWAGPKAKGQDVGPFRSSPGAGSVGWDCDDEATSNMKDSHCTPKGWKFVVEGFAKWLGSDHNAKHVTWFKKSREIAIHFYPTVPKFPASHGCVRIELESAAQLIHDNSRENLTRVIVSGTWTKPPPGKQWPGPPPPPLPPPSPPPKGDYEMPRTDVRYA